MSAFLTPSLRRQWFDTRIGDGLVERRLPASLELGRVTYYTFKISTR